MIEMRQTRDLRQHPASLEIYGENEDVSDILQSVKDNGILNPLAITPDGAILSGNRRWTAAFCAGLEEVPCYVVDLKTPEEEQVYIVESNRTRVKSATQIYNEGKKLKEALEQLSKRNCFSNLKHSLIVKNNETSLEPHRGVAREDKNPTRTAVSKALGISAGLWQRLSYIGNLAEIGNEVAQEAMALLDKGEMTITKAEKMVRAALRKESEGEHCDKPEWEPTFLETCRMEAGNHLLALQNALDKVIDTPDDEFNSVPWLSFCDELEHISDCAERLHDKISRKTRKSVLEIVSE